MNRSIVATLLLAGTAAPTLAQTASPEHRVEVKTPDGAAIGTATLIDAPRGVLINLEAKNLPPGWHGIHLHEKADCSDPKFEKAGSHVHGTTPAEHGLLNADASDSGDLPNIHAGPDGTVTASLYSTLVRLSKSDGAAPALLDADGSALVIHANADDYTTQPIGGAGARIACAVIK